MPRLYSVSPAKRHTITFALTAIMFLSAGSLYYWHTQSVRLTYDGQTRRIFTKAPRLQEFLAEQKITLGPDDFITPPLDTPVLHNTAAKITRVTQEDLVTVSTGTPVVTWQWRNRLNLRRVNVQKGFTEVTTRRMRVTRHDGAEVEREPMSTQTKKVPFFTLDLLNKEGRPVKTYDLRAAPVLHMRATGYYVGEKTVPSNVTFLGYKLRRGLVAVDPKVIPLRTRLYVVGYGYAYAADTGSAIKGNRIDLAVKDKTEEVRFNRKNVPVYLLEKAPNW